MNRLTTAANDAVADPASAARAAKAVRARPAAPVAPAAVAADDLAVRAREVPAVNVAAADQVLVARAVTTGVRPPSAASARNRNRCPR
jgi:hypothetical protein